MLPTFFFPFFFYFSNSQQYSRPWARWLLRLAKHLVLTLFLAQGQSWPWKTFLKIISSIICHKRVWRDLYNTLFILLVQCPATSQWLMSSYCNKNRLMSACRNNNITECHSFMMFLMLTWFLDSILLWSLKTIHEGLWAYGVILTQFSPKLNQLKLLLVIYCQKKNLNDILKALVARLQTNTQSNRQMELVTCSLPKGRKTDYVQWLLPQKLNSRKF